MAPKRIGTPVPTSITAMLVQNEWSNYNQTTGLLSAGQPEHLKGPSRPVAFDYPYLYNTLLGQSDVLEPSDPISIKISDLREFADEHEVTRTVIETCKEQLCKLHMGFRLKPKPGQSLLDVREESEKNADVQLLNNFFKGPDREHDWAQWLRILLEELLVVDSVPIWAQPNNAGELYALRIIDTGTIRRLVNDMGVTPDANDPYPANIAYQQRIKGKLNAEFTTDEMIYYTRNPRVWAFHGYSPVNQIILTLSTGMHRMAMQLSHYTEGNIPAMFMRAPKEWTLEQIKQWQVYWNELLSGKHGELSKGFLIPGDFEPIFPQKENLKDEFDEWVARVVCYAFSVSPNAFIKNLNRATSEQAREQADEEGLQARMQLVKNIMNQIQEKWFGFDNIEFHIMYDRPQDSKKQAEIDNLDIRVGVKSVDEVRRERGLPPIGAPNRVYINTGWLALTEGDKDNDEFQQRITNTPKEEVTPPEK